MNEIPSTPGEQPVPTPTLTPGGAQPQQSDLASLLEGQTAEQLLELLTGETPPDEVPPLVTPPPAPASAELPPGEAEVIPAAEPAASKPPGRLSVRALPAEQQHETAEALALVRDGTAIDLLDALQQLRGTKATPPAAPEPVVEAPPVVAPAVQESPTPGTVEDITSRLTGLREQRSQAKIDFDVVEEARVQSEIEDTLIELQEAKARAAQQQQAQSSYHDLYQQAVDDLERDYPDSMDDSTQFSQLLDDKIVAARVRNDPALQDPRFILKFAEDIAQVIAPKPSGTPPTGPATRAPRPTGSAVAPGHSQAPRPTADQAKAIYDAADPAALLAALTADFQGAR